MPTGYTAAVQSGEITEFKRFALQCARAFGALIEMRDAPFDEPIPDEFKPSTYYLDRLAEAEKELAKVQAMSLADCEKAAIAAFDAEVAARAKTGATKVADKARYEAMLRKAQDWVPPTSEHAGLKKFMIDQLKESIDFDCKEYSFETKVPELMTPSAWREGEIARLERDIAYHEKGWAEEQERTSQRNKWVRKLRESLS